MHNHTFQERCIPLLKSKSNFFGNTFFPSSVIEWNKLHQSLKDSESFSIFKKQLLKIIRPSENSIYDCNDAVGIKFITRLRLGLSHLREHKFKHNFQDTLNPICSCGRDTETTSHFLLHCPNYVNERMILLNTIRAIDSSILDLDENQITETLLYGNNLLRKTINTSILNATINFLICTKRFDESLLQSI